LSVAQASNVVNKAMADAGIRDHKELWGSRRRLLEFNVDVICRHPQLLMLPIISLRHRRQPGGDKQWPTGAFESRAERLDGAPVRFAVFRESRDLDARREPSGSAIAHCA
jgi:hypothetical protein